MIQRPFHDKMTRSNTVTIPLEVTRELKVEIMRSVDPDQLMKSHSASMEVAKC